MQTTSTPITLSSFYKFVPLADCERLREPIRQRLQHHGLRGTITLAPEGINATISGEKNELFGMLDYLQSHPEIGSFEHKENETNGKQPFKETKVKVKPELISLGEPADPNVCVGTYVAPSEWNALISRPDVITIDTRNDYEYRLGHFKGAINPDTSNFKETVAFTKTHLNPKTHPHVAMYCTGGIRCEKYSSYLLGQGFENVYHLHGGVLQYLADIPQAETMWEGACFVFDERVAVNHDLSPATHITMCYGCGNPNTPEDRAYADYIAGQHCQYCENKR